MKNFFQTLFKPRAKYQPLIEVRVFKDSLLHNLQTYKQAYPRLQFAPVLKSNAYGHGLEQVGKILDAQGCPFFMVDSFYEALTLRQHGVKNKILILGYNREEQILNNKLKNCSFGIIDFEQLKIITTKLNKPQTFHLKIDTGMHRQGITADNIMPAIKLIKQNPNFILEGLCSHLADADNGSPAFTDEQITAWNQAAEQFKHTFPKITYFHLGNTAGASHSAKTTANVNRLGIGLYGINPSPSVSLDLKPALEIVSVISSLKNLPVGERVGYGLTYRAGQPVRLATVPVGYNEGVDRRLSNKGSFKIGKVFCPLAGRVSMNMSSIDVSPVPEVKIGDEVLVISADENDQNSVENLAKLCGCIPYEILVHIPQHLRRVII